MTTKEFFNKPGVAVGIMALAVLSTAWVKDSGSWGIAGVMLYCTAVLCEHISKAARP